MKTDYVISERQKLEEQSMFALEDVLCTKMKDRRSQVRNPSSQVELDMGNTE